MELHTFRINLILFIYLSFKEVKSLKLYEVCKLTPLGFEYSGHLSKTQSEEECEYWDSISHEEMGNITSENFPDGSLRMARNYCRNPNHSKDGLWCFTVELKKANCTIPTCKHKENCRVTGPGMEYAGSVQKSIYDNECIPWVAVYKEGENDTMFPEGSILLAGRSCRNPTGHVDGPWCYVHNDKEDQGFENETNWVIETCDVPTCFAHQFVSVIKNVQGNPMEQYYTHFSSIVNDLEEINFSIKLWNPADWQEGEIRICLTSMITPVNGSLLREWDIGYEIFIRNKRSGATPTSGEDESWEDTSGLVSGIEWTDLKLTWSNGFIALVGPKQEKPYFIHEYKGKEDGILAKNLAKIKYISIMGTPAFWNLSMDENYCQEHITTNLKISRFWVLSSATMSKYLEFYIRTFGYSVIEFRQSPLKEYPKVLLKMHEEVGKIRLVLINNGTGEEMVASAVSNSLSYWRWEEFSITIAGQRLRMLQTTNTGQDTLLDLQNIIFQGIKWYGIASYSTTHWTFFCKPLQMEFEATPPECSTSNQDRDYKGHLWVTKSGLACIPWAGYANANLNNDQFPDGSVAAALNYCRNPSGDSGGIYCHAIKFTEESNIIMESCALRKCKFKDCRIAGTGNDFMGELNKTISGRECQSWTSNQPHTVEKQLLQDHLYPERSLLAAKNYCRDPSNNMAGPWCYTQDPKVKEDLCNVPDCYKPTECTLLVATRANKQVFMVPEWRAYGLPFWVKMWNPNISTTLVLNFFPLNDNYTYRLILGDMDNEIIKLYYLGDSGTEILLKQKTLTHLLSSGRWIGFIIDLQEDKIQILYENAEKPFFIWRKSHGLDVPKVGDMFFNYEAKSKDDKGTVALNFPCDVCHTEICLGNLYEYSVFYPVNVWQKNVPIPMERITFYARGEGEFMVNFYTMPSKYPKGKLFLDGGVSGDLMEVQLVRGRYMDRVAVKHKGSPAIVGQYWSKISMDIKEDSGSLILNGSTFLEWKFPSLPLYYYFSVQCTEEIIWIANCPPPKIDGTPVNGNWSPWSAWECSVSCGGGRGIRRRKCNHPEASMFGLTCPGPSTDIGICNEYDCGEISINTVQLIREELANKATNIFVDTKDVVVINCSSTILKLIKEEAPKTMVYWQKNGFKILEETKIKDVDPDNYQLVINSAKSEDTGLYTCVAVGEDQVREIVDISALIVRSKDPTLIHRIGSKLILKANSKALNNLYENLRLSWYLDDEPYKEYDVTDLSLIDQEVIHNVKKKHAGVWTSVVFQEELGLNWTTSWYRLLLKGRANLATYLMEEDLLRGALGTNEIVVYVIYITILVVFILITAFATRFIIKLYKSFNKK